MRPRSFAPTSAAPSVRVERFVPVERESPLALTLAQGIVASDAMDSAIRKATELGVTAIQPLVTARSAPLPDGERGDKRVAPLAADRDRGRGAIGPQPDPGGRRAAFHRRMASRRGTEPASSSCRTPTSSFAAIAPPRAAARRADRSRRRIRRARRRGGESAGISGAPARPARTARRHGGRGGDRRRAVGVGRLAMRRLRHRVAARGARRGLRHAAARRGARRCEGPTRSSCWARRARRSRA